MIKTETNEPVKNNRFLIHLEKLDLKPEFVYEVGPLKRTTNFIFGLFKSYKWDNVILTLRELKDNMFTTLLDLQDKNEHFSFYYEVLAPDNETLEKWYVKTDKIESVEMNDRTYNTGDLNKINVEVSVKDCYKVA